MVHYIFDLKKRKKKSYHKESGLSLSFKELQVNLHVYTYAQIRKINLPQPPHMYKIREHYTTWLLDFLNVLKISRKCVCTRQQHTV
jgi:hypothetical protein